MQFASRIHYHTCEKFRNAIVIINAIFSNTATFLPQFNLARTGLAP